MKKNKILLFTIIYLIFLVNISIANAATTMDQYYGVDTSKKVYDYANLFTDDEEKDLYDRLKKTIDKYDTDVVIATISDNPQSTTQIFAENFYDQNHFGKGSDNEGILLVIDMEKREYYLVTTGETMKIINDNRIENILDAMELDMRDGDYYYAAKDFIKKTNQYYSYHKYGPPLLWLNTIIFALVFAIIMLNKEKKKLNLINDRLEASNYLLDKTIEYQDDTLIDTRTRVITHSSSSGGGSGGGGGSHGGGGRSF